jgi:hypothetical protein
MKKLILRLIILGFVAVTLLYAKTIGIFVKAFFAELMASPKKA